MALALALAAAVGLLGAACTADGTNGADGSTPAASGALPGPYTQAEATFRTPDGRVVQTCALVADTTAERTQGLMEVEDLDPWDAIVFDFGEPVMGTFWMKDTVLALSIAFYDEFGVFVSSADMEPCLGDDCPSTGAERPYRWAVEVEQGRLEELGAVFGGSLQLGAACEVNAEGG